MQDTASQIELVEYFESVYSFEDPEIVVGATSGVVRQPGRGFTHGYEIHLEKVMLTFEFAVIDGEGVVLMPCTVLPQKGKAKQPKLGDGDPMCAFEQEIKTVVKSIKSGQAPPMLQSQLAQDAILLCHKQTDSVRKGRTVKVS